MSSLAAAFVSVILIWSTTPLAIKWSALGVGFSFAVFARMSLGALLCALLLLYRLPSRPHCARSITTRRTARQMAVA